MWLSSAISRKTNCSFSGPKNPNTCLQYCIGPDYAITSFASDSLSSLSLIRLWLFTCILTFRTKVEVVLKPPRVCCVAASHQQLCALKPQVICLHALVNAFLIEKTAFYKHSFDGTFASCCCVEVNKTNIK